ncbi:MAG: hypothetical protein J6D34_09050 [Atopobiaceae bacterium]|nr:hypothetical protein [Atopobiaceae bacterium]
MANNTQALLAETGFGQEQAQRFLVLEAEGRTDECIRMLRCKRCELVDALHEAQRPIDVLDWAIRDLEKRA